MALTIHRTPEPPRLIRMGHGSKPIDPEADTPKRIEAAAANQSEPPPVVQPENKRGRPKKMADKKITDETGVKKISEEDAGTQGAVGSGGVNAPAQEKVPEKPQGSDKEE